MVAGAAIALASPEFTLDWTHSVEKIEWRENWRIEGDRLHLARAAIKGSGAGMEPGPDATLQGGWWVWTPDLPPQSELLLASSGATVSAWHLCDAQTCRDLGKDPGQPIALRPCSAN